MTRITGRRRTVVLLGGAMAALMLSFGWQAEHWGESRIALAVGVAALVFVPLCVLLAFVLGRAELRAQRPPEEGRPYDVRHTFCFLLLCYVPMFLITFPGSFAYDVPFQLKQVFTGTYSTHHPLLHTLLLGGCVALGRAVGQVNLGAALYTLLQMVGLSGCFALTCASIARQAGAQTARRCALYFALYPLHMMMAVNATKDTLFSGCFALLLALLMEAVHAPRMRRSLAAGIVLCGLLLLLLRNNALYALAVWLVLLLIGGRRRVLPLAGTLLLSLALAQGGGMLLRTATHAQAGDMSEMLSWPIQQMARARLYCADQLTQDERDAVDALMPGEAWQAYDPTISDPVKFEFDTQRLLSDPEKYVSMYLSVGAKCPKVYFDALLMHTYSFWYPYSRYGVSGYYLQMGVSESYYDGWCDFEPIQSQSLMPRLLASLSWRFGAQGAMQIPVIGWAFNMGLIVLTMFYFVLRAAYLGDWSRFIVGLLAVLLWGTYLLGPVMAGRYIYPFICALPVLGCRVQSRGAGTA